MQDVVEGQRQEWVDARVVVEILLGWIGVAKEDREMQDGQRTRRFVAVATSTDLSNHISALDALTLGHQRIAEVLISTVPRPDGIGVVVKDDGMGKIVLDLDDQSTTNEA